MRRGREARLPQPSWAEVDGGMSERHRMGCSQRFSMFLPVLLWWWWWLRHLEGTHAAIIVHEFLTKKKNASHRLHAAYMVHFHRESRMTPALLAATVSHNPIDG